MIINVRDQYRIINDPMNPEITRVPEMPLIIAFRNGLMGEALSIRGAMAIVIGNEYLDCEDSEDEWHYRVQKSREVAMKALAYDINVIVYDERNTQNDGVILNNYAADPEDLDYLDDEDPEEPPFKIRIENDKVFLLSLMRLGEIQIFERADSSLLLPGALFGLAKCCDNCGFKIKNETPGILCPVYNAIKAPEEGTDCICWKHESNNTSSPYTYIDIVKEYAEDRLDELIKSLI